MTVTEVPETGSTIVEATETPAFHAGEHVNVSEVAVDGRGYSSGSVRGTVAVLDFFDSYEGWYVRPIDGAYGAYVDVSHLTHVSEADMLRATIATLESNLATAQQQRTEALDALTLSRQQSRDALARTLEGFETWKQNLQAVAYEAAQENSLCQVFDDVMERVGLEGRERAIDVSVDFNGSTTITVHATSTQRARDMIDRDSILDRIRNGSAYGASIDDWTTDLDDN